MPIGEAVTGGSLFGGAAIIGVLAGFWGYIKIYASKIVSLLVVRVELQDEGPVAFSTLLHKEFKCSPLGKKNFQAYSEYVRPLDKNQIVAFERLPSEPTIWWRGKRPLIVSGESYGTMNITFIRWIYNKDKLIQEAVDKFNKRKSRKDWKQGDRFFVRKLHGTIGSTTSTRQSGDGSVDEVAAPKIEGNSSSDKYTKRPLKWDHEQLGQPNNKNAVDKLSLSEDTMSAMKESILWRDSEDWFKERSIPWKRGWLLHGSPGTGKTAFVRALGQELNMPIFAFDLATMTNKDLSDNWSTVMGRSPCIALFEDIDAIFKGRDNISVKGMENGITFDSFLNCLDGVENTDGIFVVVTTNDISTIDPAIGNPVNGEGMSTRPGRIDRAIKFESLDEAGRMKMATRIMSGIPEEKWEHLVTKYKDDTGAQFQERCCRLALKLFWEEKTA